MKSLALFCIRLYQWALSPFTGCSCRFYPTCSQYAYQAIETHGILKGGWLAAKRILKCNPWHPGGYDPVPLPRQLSIPEQPKPELLPKQHCCNHHAYGGNHSSDHQSSDHQGDS